MSLGISPFIKTANTYPSIEIIVTNVADIPLVVITPYASHLPSISIRQSPGKYDMPSPQVRRRPRVPHSPQTSAHRVFTLPSEAAVRAILPPGAADNLSDSTTAPPPTPPRRNPTGSPRSKGLSALKRIMSSLPRSDKGHSPSKRLISSHPRSDKALSPSKRAISSAPRGDKALSSGKRINAGGFTVWHCCQCRYRNKGGDGVCAKVGCGGHAQCGNCAEMRIVEMGGW